MDQPAPADPHAAVDSAIQNLVVSRLSRGFVPLGFTLGFSVSTRLSATLSAVLGVRTPQ